VGKLTVVADVNVLVDAKWKGKVFR